MGQAAIILTNYRTGGTFLSLCLDSHPLIFCQRAEPLSTNSVFAKHFGHPGRTAILRAIFGNHMCRVAMAKIIYRQCGGSVWKLLEEMDAKVVHLIRKNALRAAVSYQFHVLSKEAGARALHNFDRNKQRPEPQELDPHEVIALCRKRGREYKDVQGQLQARKLAVHPIYYEHITGGGEIKSIPDQYTRGICEFLEVPYYPLSAPFMRRVNDWPLSELISNWREFKMTVMESPYGKWLEGEG